MNTRYLSDGHIHTKLCKHATGEMYEYVEAAIKAGLKEICFLEHMEVGINSSRVIWLSDKEFDLYFSQGKKLQDKYASQIKIGLGVEVGYNPAEVLQTLQRLQERKWDRIGISYHYYKLAHDDEHLNLVSRSDKRMLAMTTEEVKAVEREYYTSLIEAISLLPGTHLCHIDAIFRYHPLRHTITPPYDMIEILLEKAIEQKMTLEVNTSGFHIRDEQFPAHSILKLALDKGISLSLGSDAHKPSDVGGNFDLVRSILNHRTQT